MFNGLEKKAVNRFKQTISLIKYTQIFSLFDAIILSVMRISETFLTRTKVHSLDMLDFQ